VKPRTSAPSSIPRIDIPTGLRHRAFLEALADGEPTSSTWLAARAGLLALRYVDAWASGEWLPVQLLAERSAVCDAIGEIPTGNQFRGLLAVLLERTTTEWVVTSGGEAHPLPPPIARIASPLLAYAHALQFSSQWAMAADVYLTVWEACGPDGWQSAQGVADADSAMTAALRLGACYRTLGEAERAGMAYAAAMAMARDRGDVRTVLCARLGEAKLIQERGNLPLADERIAEIIRDANTSHLQDIRAWAFHDRSAVAFHRGQFRAAVEWGFESWALERDPLERERVLGDLANALFGGGYVDLARSADRLLLATAHEPYVRWAVTISLVEIATIERDKVEFDRLAQSLRTVVLPPILLADYHYYVGQGEAVFGRTERARQELERAIGLAEQHGLGEIVIKAEAALVRIREGQRATPTYRQVPVPPEFTHITDALHGACAAALAERE
jgi:tetratricopeptide (TPR) repeat protein